MTTGRINQVTVLSALTSSSPKKRRAQRRTQDEPVKDSHCPDEPRQGVKKSDRSQIGLTPIYTGDDSLVLSSHSLHQSSYKVTAGDPYYIGPRDFLKTCV